MSENYFNFSQREHGGYKKPLLLNILLAIDRDNSDYKSLSECFTIAVEAGADIEARSFTSISDYIEITKGMEKFSSVNDILKKAQDEKMVEGEYYRYLSC